MARSSCRSERSTIAPRHPHRRTSFRSPCVIPKARALTSGRGISSFSNPYGPYLFISARSDSRPRQSGRAQLDCPVALCPFVPSVVETSPALTISPRSARIFDVIHKRTTSVPVRGPVAQLGARFHGMEEVVGSIPTRSTIFSSTYGYARFQFGVIWCQNALTSSKLRSGQPLVAHGWFPLTNRL